MVSKGRAFLLVLILLVILSLCDGRRYRKKSSSRSRSIVAHVTVDVKHVRLIQRSLGFPHIIPLVFGNSIYQYKTLRDRSYQVYHTRSIVTNIQPMVVNRRRRRNVAGFKFKQYSLGAHPVPMENSVFFLRVRQRRSYARLFMWIASNGLYNRNEALSQRIYIRSLVNEYADNVRRVLGVANCKNIITVSGLCNNPSNPFSGTTLQKMLAPTKNFKRPTTRNMNRMQPNIRYISKAIVKTNRLKFAPYKTNLFFVIFGQFVDHEIVLSPQESIDSESKVPIMDRRRRGRMDFTRNGVLRFIYGKCCPGNYQTSLRVWDSIPFNRLTSFIDGSAVYGSSHLRVNTLRAFEHGKIILQRINGESLMPFNSLSQLKFNLHNENSDSNTNLFAGGDVRANENIFLAAIHTLFAKEHNRICDLLRRHLRRNRDKKLLKDAWLFATARQILSAELQSIVFREFVPLLLGKRALPRYTGYKPKIDARISMMHAGFAYRWGHSGIAESFFLKSRRDGKSQFRRLRDVFFNTRQFLNFGVDNIVEGAINTTAMDIDETIVESLRASLFKPPSRGALDLAAINIQRGRDLGFSYLQAQKMMGTGRKLENIRRDVRRKLLKVYRKPDLIDAFIGCMSEKKVRGALLGPLCWKINQQQFLNLRDGDRFYYENVKWHPAIQNMPLIRKIRSHKYTMADLVHDNTNLDRKLRRGQSLFKTTSLLSNRA